MSAGISLIVGLGNPGSEYERTRHNAGVWFVNALADQAHASLKQVAKFHGFHCLTTLAGRDCHLLLPSTFMNLSGQSIKAAANYYKISPQEILIAHDEVDIPTGDIRLKFDGGHGGHNGLKNTISHLGTHQFHRLRIGVGRPTHGEVVDYVLNAPSKVERKEIDNCIESALHVMPFLMEGEFQKAMMQLHTKE